LVRNLEGEDRTGCRRFEDGRDARRRSGRHQNAVVGALEHTR
jgi:hypothetical protein